MKTRRGRTRNQNVSTTKTAERIQNCFLLLVGYCWIISCSAASTSGYDAVPWQPPTDHTAIDEAARYQDFPVSVFSPTGRLFPVEAAVRASKQPTPLSNLVVACNCKEGIIIVATLAISAHVDDASSSSSNSNSTSLLLDHDDNTVQGPIFDLDPCILGATAGNAVDNQILKQRLLGLTTVVDPNDDDEVSSGSLAKDLANQLQVVTQDIAASQKQKLGRLLASTALIVGNQKIWRIDPTGQFWDCHATVLGMNADRTEEILYKRLLEECQSRNLKSPQELLESLSAKEALELVCDFLETNIAKQQQQQKEAKSAESKKSSEETTKTTTTTTNTTSEDEEEASLSSPVYWQGVILDYSSLTRKGSPRRTWKRGVFGVRQKNQV
eukprot:CAMPEP_0116147000 /NCGR_PEP_ID=MMETSP0329-20121206/17496_1 /TAXON_ID=697910 /ORGANISM="Pseudo-nitzschia arenysensis, Strain B593" /LENGTH=382 /DNA_ID=CAMNT_0003642849 /DNA_START=50 /DNA_END=1198 /DNA_ORIENTATION=+